MEIISVCVGSLKNRRYSTSQSTYHYSAKLCNNLNLGKNSITKSSQVFAGAKFRFSIFLPLTCFCAMFAANDVFVLDNRPLDEKIQSFPLLFDRSAFIFVMRNLFYRHFWSLDRQFPFWYPKEELLISKWVAFTALPTNSRLSLGESMSRFVLCNWFDGNVFFSSEQNENAHRVELKCFFWEPGNRENQQLLNRWGIWIEMTKTRLFRILHESGFSAEDYRQYKAVVYMNTVQSLVAILRAMFHLSVSFGRSDREVWFFKIILINLFRRMLDSLCRPLIGWKIRSPLATSFSSRWSVCGPIAAFRTVSIEQTSINLMIRRNSGIPLVFHENPLFSFLDSLDRIGQFDYQPTEQDILRTRVKVRLFSFLLIESFI